jgi:hypothetical protein
MYARILRAKFEERCIIVTHIQVQSGVAPSGCTTNAVLQLSNGVSSRLLTLNSLASDTGTISVNFAAGIPIKMTVSTAAKCSVPPGFVNVAVQYKSQ